MFGVVIRNDKGEIMVTSVSYLPFTLTPEVAEFQAARYGLSLAKDM